MQKSESDIRDKELLEFLSSQPAEVPESLSRSILSSVQVDLHPSAFKVFGKVFLFQVVVGFITLLFCPQFGFSMTASMGIMPYLMKLGEHICMFGCGVFFTSLNFLVASFLLRPEEARVLRQREILYVASVTALALGFFICFGEKIIFTFGLVWLCGAIFGGLVTFETGWWIRWVLKRKGFI